MNLLVPVLIASLAMGSGAPAASSATADTSQDNTSIIVFEQTAEEKARLEEEARLQAEAEAKAAEEAAKQNMENGNYQYDIASYTTNYSTSAANTDRNYNMQLACNAINGTILLPGEEFSYNDALFAVGNPYEDYRYAGAYSNGEVVSAIGGGICQVSTTLFDAALYTGMTITYRQNHSMPVGYVPKGMDATVSWGSIDFRFRNDYDAPVKIEATMNNGALKIRFLSTEKLDVSGITLEVTQSSGGYHLTRYRNAVADYTTSSYYRSAQQQQTQPKVQEEKKTENKIRLPWEI